MLLVKKVVLKSKRPLEWAIRLAAGYFYQEASTWAKHGNFGEKLYCFSSCERVKLQFYKNYVNYSRNYFNDALSLLSKELLTSKHVIASFELSNFVGLQHKIIHCLIVFCLVWRRFTLHLLASPGLNRMTRHLWSGSLELLHRCLLRTPFFFIIESSRCLEMSPDVALLHLNIVSIFIDIYDIQVW